MKKIILILCVLFLGLNFAFSQSNDYRKYPQASEMKFSAEDPFLLVEEVHGPDINQKELLWELRIMRNEIYAAKGYIFKTKAMKGYFAKQNWYVPKYNSVKLSAIEQNNVAKIKAEEKNWKK